jgi:hypothetical protein
MGKGSGEKKGVWIETGPGAGESLSEEDCEDCDWEDAESWLGACESAGETARGKNSGGEVGKPDPYR